MSDWKETHRETLARIRQKLKEAPDDQSITQDFSAAIAAMRLELDKLQAQNKAEGERIKELALENDFLLVELQALKDGSE